MIRFPDAVAAWGTPAFERTLKTELESCPVAALPLQQALATTSYALDGRIEAMVLSAAEHDGVIRVRAGVFFSGLVAGCSCADDPTPVEAQPEYCVLQLDIDRTTGEATARAVEDEPVSPGRG